MTTSIIGLTNESSMPTTRSVYELFDDSEYQVGTSGRESTPIVIVINPTPVTKKPPRTGHRLRDVIKQITSESTAAAEFNDARRWVAQEVYASEPYSLQALRLKLGLSQTDVAKLANTTQTRISKIENGEELPRFDTMKRLAQALGIDMNTLASAIDRATTRKSHETVSS